MAEETTGSSTAAPASAPAPSAPAAAPASAAPATDVKRPANFGAALRDAAKEGSSPSATPAPESAPAAATVLPTDAGSPTEPGPVPYPRFSEENVAKKAALEKLKTAEAQLQAWQWAQGMSPQAVQNAVRWQLMAQQDPERFVNHVISTAPPHLQAALRQGLTPQSQRDPEPQPDITTDTGQPVYSARQQVAWAQWNSRQQLAEVQKLLAPLQEESRRNREMRAQAQQAYETHTFAQGFAKEMQEWPHFKENAREIIAELQKIPPGATPAEERLAGHQAYLAVLRRSVLPNLSGRAQAELRTELKTKAVAGAERPGGNGTADVSRPKSMGEALRRELAKAGR